jgi:hypothetical protein
MTARAAVLFISLYFSAVRLAVKTIAGRLRTYQIHGQYIHEILPKPGLPLNGAPAMNDGPERVAELRRVLKETKPGIPARESGQPIPESHSTRLACWSAPPW